MGVARVLLSMLVPRCSSSLAFVPVLPALCESWTGQLSSCTVVAARFTVHLQRYDGSVSCAQELHMNVLEISPGMDRSGNNLVKLVGEATQSHTVVCKGMFRSC